MRFFVFFGNLFNRKKNNKINTPEHESKSPLDQMVEDYIEIAKFVLNKANIKDIEEIEMDKFSLRQFRVKTKDGKQIKLFVVYSQF